MPVHADPTAVVNGRPVVSEAAERLYADLGPWREGDDARGYPLLSFCEALVGGLQDIESIIRDTDDGPGWSAIMDPDRAPVEYLGWLGQFIGVRTLVGLDEASQRLRLKEASGMRRGTVAALEGAARQWLTGSRQVIIIERDGSPYRLTVRTYIAETPDQARVVAALQAEKPAGLVLTYQAVSGATYAQLSAYRATYASLDTAFGTYEDQTLYVP